MAKWLGASDEMLPYCISYGRIAMAGVAPFLLQYDFQAFFVTAGKPRYGLYFTLGAGITNMVLDALFVGMFCWGVEGAAAATVISYIVGGVLPIFYFTGKNHSNIHIVHTHIEGGPVLQACTNGISEFLSNIAASIVGIIYNIQLMKYYGANGVAAYGSIMYVEFIFVSIFVGYTIGSSPIVSYHYGARDNAELHNIFRKSLALMILGGIAMLAFAQGISSPLCKLYVGYDKELYDLTLSSFRIYSWVYLICGINIFASAFFTALNNGGVSVVISVLRTLVFKVSAIMALPLLFGAGGIWYAEFTSEGFAMILSLSFLFGLKKKYGY